MSDGEGTLTIRGKLILSLLAVACAGAAWLYLSPDALSKAQQLVGGQHNPVVPAGKDAMSYYFEQHKIDISLGYCSSRQTTPDPKFASVELPPELAVHADYGLSVLTAGGGSHEAALRFALFVMSPEAQHVIGLYGFTPVAEGHAGM